jgi:ribosomal protein S18 acetylase RimI-like enzyme
MINSLKIKGIQDLPVHKSLFIRPFNKSDLPVILHIERVTQLTPWSKQNFKDSLQHGHICRALLKNNEIIGFIVFSIQASECEILNLCIKPEQQNKSYGFKLLHGIKKAYYPFKNKREDAIIFALDLTAC